MASTYLSLHYHLIFSTKNREAVIVDKWRGQLHEYLGGTVRGLGGVPEIVGGVADHVHLLVGLKSTHCLADFMRDLKRSSTGWIQSELSARTFAWQEGYAAFTVSATGCDRVREYILTQEEHHRTTSFRDELVKLLQWANVEYDPRYLD